MKKTLLLLSVVALSALTSCKKDRVCACTYTSTAPSTPGVSNTHTSEFTMTKISKGAAKDACVKTTNDYIIGGVTYVSTNDCKLK